MLWHGVVCRVSLIALIRIDMCLFTALQAHHKELLSQQPAFILATQSAQAFLDRHGESLAPGEKERLSSDLASLRAQYEGRLSRCEAQLKRATGLREELDKFLTEHGEFSSWLELSEQELRSLGEGQSDAQGLRDRAQRHRKFSEDVICHKADLRFITISGQKVLDAAGAGSGTGEGEPELDPSSTRLLVQGKLQDATDRFSQLHAKVRQRLQICNAIEILKGVDRVHPSQYWRQTQDRGEETPLHTGW